MRPLSAPELIQVWEQGVDQPLTTTALTMLAIASGEARDALAAMSIGQRDARLLSLREQTFGPIIRGFIRCPQCGARLETSFTATDIRTRAPGFDDPASSDNGLVIHVDEYEARFRLPNSLDLAQIVDAPDVVTARGRLLECCVLAVYEKDLSVPLESAPDSVGRAVIARMSEVDSQADVQLDLTCPVCGASWLTAFDIAAFLWREVSVWASRTLREVHALASAYGWREADILAMSSTRRRSYLDMVGG